MDISSTPAHIAELEQRLDALRETYRDQPVLYEMNSQGILHHLDILRDETRERIHDPVSASDIWIELNGSHFGRAGGLIRTVAATLEGFRITTQYAASTFTDAPSTTGRFTKRVSEAANFFLTAATPGSLRLGLDHQPLRDSLQVEERDIEDVLNEVDDRRELGLNAVRRLVRALQATTDDATFSQLQDDIGSERTFLIMSQIDRLLPSGVDQIRFGGAEVRDEGEEERPLLFEREAVLRGQKRRLSESSGPSVGEPRVQLQAPVLRRLGRGAPASAEAPLPEEVASEEYAEGQGVLSMLDLDNELVRIRTVQFGTRDERLAMLLGRPTGGLSGLAELLNRSVRFEGMLGLDQAGVPRQIKLDTVALAPGG